VTAAEAESLLDLACEVAVAAGRLLIGSGGRPEVVATKSSPTDVVTEADQAAEALIRDLIGEKRPGDRILGEEGGETGDGTGGPGGLSDVRWIVDPLDGTVNYLYGLPDWAVSVAAEVDGTVVAGAVFGYAAGRRQVQGDVLRAVLPLVRDIRRGGSAAVDLCSVASGTVDAYYERGVNLWDIAAGGLIAAEAGAQVTGLHGMPPSPSMTLAAPPPLLGELHDLLASTDPERDA
jgi:myo-inositol-1(or 4)-monophosphatase